MIRRSEHSAEKKFVMISRRLAQDKRLSFQARGLLVYVLSKPIGWQVKDSDLMKQGGIKKHAFNSILSELKTLGYARRLRERKPGGIFEWILELFEEPQEVTAETPLPDFPVVDKPSVDNQAVAINSTRAQAGSSTDLTRSKEKEPLFSIEEMQNPNSIPGLRNQLAIYTHVPYDDAYADWYSKYQPRGGIGRAVGSKCTVTQYATHIEGYFRKWERNATTNGNGHKQGEDEIGEHPAWMASPKPVGYFDEISAQYQKK